MYRYQYSAASCGEEGNSISEDITRVENERVILHVICVVTAGVASVNVFMRSYPKEFIYLTHEREESS
jgi:uncharacterized protein with ATP-grasp and redox domains